jgi:hypothetical protein
MMETTGNAADDLKQTTKPDDGEAILAPRRPDGLNHIQGHRDATGAILRGQFRSKAPMIDVIVHYRGIDSERRRLPAVPVAGSYVYGPGAKRRLWEVAAVALDGDGVDVYVVAVSAMLTSELTATWATWGDDGAKAGNGVIDKNQGMSDKERSRAKPQTPPDS